MIPSAEVAKLAHRLGVGDRVIEKDYVLSWLLIAIAESELQSGLVFKGQDPERLDEVLTGKVGTFDRLWISRLAVQVPDLPHLNEVLRTVRRHLRGLRLI